MMKGSSLQFKISQLRQQKMIALIESIAVLFFSIFTAALLPQLLYRYVYANQELMEQPKILEYIPLAAFVLGLAFFVYVIITNGVKAMQIKKLEAELETMGEGMCVGCDENCMCDGHMCEDCNCEGCTPNYASESSMSSSDSTSMMAERMKQASSKKKTGKKK